MSVCEYTIHKPETERKEKWLIATLTLERAFFKVLHDSELQKETWDGCKVGGMYDGKNNVVVDCEKGCLTCYNHTILLHFYVHPKKNMLTIKLTLCLALHFLADGIWIRRIRLVWKSRKQKWEGEWQSWVAKSAQQSILFTLVHIWAMYRNCLRFFWFLLLERVVRSVGDFMGVIILRKMFLFNHSCCAKGNNYFYPEC